jgi:8-oxo-dGTP diphosphatase
MTSKTTTDPTGTAHAVASLTADVVLFHHDLEADSMNVLLVRRQHEPYAGLWALPGGRVDHDETSREAAVRELSEETGIILDEKWLHLAGVYDGPDRDPRGRYVSIAFVAELDQDWSLVAGSDADDAQWMPVNPGAPGMVDPPTGGLAFDHDRIIKDAIRMVLDW